MKKQILVSDMSGDEIPEGTGALITGRPFDNRKSNRELHVTDAEFEKLGGRIVSRRGRKPAPASGGGGSRRRSTEPAKA